MCEVLVVCLSLCHAVWPCRAVHGSSTALLFASSSPSCEGGPFSWGHTVVFLVSCVPSGFCPLFSEVFEVVQSNACKWDQWRKKGDGSVGRNRAGSGGGV